MRRNNKMPNRTIFDFFEHQTKASTITMTTLTSKTPMHSVTMQPEFSSTTPATSTATPTVNFEKSSEIIDSLDTIQGFLILIVIQLFLVIIYKLVKLCKQGYEMHKEKIIRIHEIANPRL